MRTKYFFYVVILFIVITVIFSGCKSQQPVIIDTGDIERLRYEFESLRSEYERLQSDYKQLTEDSKFYADYYQHTTEAIATGIGELSEIGADSATEITKIRSYITILKNIMDNIIEGKK